MIARQRGGALDKFEVFRRQGFDIFEADDRPALETLRQDVFAQAKTIVGDGSNDPEIFFNAFHKRGLKGGDLNAFRMKLVSACTDLLKVNRAVFKAFEKTLGEMVGADVAAQKVVNIVIQQPGDADQVMTHRDAPANSHFEVITWLPLVDVYGTKSMFISDLETSSKAADALKKGGTYDSYCKAIEATATDLKVPFGSACLFAAGIAHGAKTNVTDETRWALNIRYKNLFSPYGDKGILEFFDILKLSPLSNVAFELERREYS
jgi:sporadic carbohydrate cluster 2OG-Fe(II) oxygenase